VCTQICAMCIDYIHIYHSIFVVIFDSAADICDLKIIKDVTEAKLLTTSSGQQYGKKTSDAQTLTHARHNDRHLGPKVHDDSIVSFQQAAYDVPQTHTRNTVSSNEANAAQGFKSTSAASPRKTSVKGASRPSNNKKSQNVDSRSSPYKKQTNGIVQSRHVNGTSRVKAYDTGRITGCSPSDLSASVQSMTVSDEIVRSTDCFHENNQRNIFRKRTTSGIRSVKC